MARAIALHHYIKSPGVVQGPSPRLMQCSGSPLHPQSPSTAPQDPLFFSSVHCQCTTLTGRSSLGIPCLLTDVTALHTASHCWPGLLPPWGTDLSCNLGFCPRSAPSAPATHGPSSLEPVVMGAGAGGVEVSRRLSRPRPTLFPTESSPRLLLAPPQLTTAHLPRPGQCHCHIQATTFGLPTAGWTSRCI